MISKEEIIRLKLSGERNIDIASRLGCSRQHVGQVLREAGLTRQNSSAPPELVSFRPEIAAHREQHAYRMLKLYDKRRAREPLTAETLARLDGFLRNSEGRIWTYNEDEGFYSKVRQTHHPDEIFDMNA